MGISLLFRSFSFVCILFAFFAGDCRAEGKAAARELTFEKDIRPIFRAHCYDCHGAEKEMKGKLDLRLVRFISKGGESGPAIVAGNAKNSLMLNRIKAGEMPPGDKRVSAKEIAILERWIAAGAKTARPEPKTIEPGLGITPEERAWWAFQPIRRPKVIMTGRTSRIRTPIDALLKSAMPKGLEFSNDADRLTLIMRAYFDLTGLPPTPEDVQAVLKDTSADWYESLVDKLLKSPHYGERWARHWLDVAGYADSEGYTNRDDIRSWAWKYRDYVIRSFNDDKPFNRFITEQLAGDELAGPKKGDWTSRQIELLTATGFLRMAADGTGSGANTPVGKNQVMTDTIKIVSTSLLGLSVACAQCHDHRYDPIPQKDYYALRSVFEPALDWKKWRTPAQRRVSLYTIADRKKAAEIEAGVKVVAAEKAKKLAEYMQQALEIELKKYKSPLKEELRTAYQTPAAKRNAKQKQLLKKYPSVNITPGVLYQYIAKSRPELKKFDDRIAAIRSKKPKEEFLRTLIEPAGHAPQTKLFHRGDYRQPLDVVEPAALTVATPEGERRVFASKQKSAPTTQRRLAFAKWLTSGRDPLVARVLVNRIWMHHFGLGIVSTPGDFGRLGTKPTHPELLDWLADEFIRQGWSLKKLHRVIMLSTVYRQSSRRNDVGDSIDPENNFYGRKPLMRLEAETLRDRMLAVSGSLDRTLYGPPLAIKENETGQVVVNGEQKRRSMYIQVRRSRPVGMLQTFDAPVMETNCEKRSNSTVATQSLMLLNGEFIRHHASQLSTLATAKAPPLTAKALASVPNPNTIGKPEWQHGYGRFDTKSRRTLFSPLAHWNGSRWQAGVKVPDAKHGWVFLTAVGGHPGDKDHATIRRWTATTPGRLSIAGALQHHSPHGDGVGGIVVSSRSGLLGEWVSHNKQVQTNIKPFDVTPGETIDFIAHCRSSVTSDSFSWPVTLTWNAAGKPARTITSASGFRGPAISGAKLLASCAEVWRRAFCREPTSAELRVIAGFATRQMEYLQSHPGQLPKGVSSTQQVLTNLCQVLMSSNEFLYVD